LSSSGKRTHARAHTLTRAHARAHRCGRDGISSLLRVYLEPIKGVIGRRAAQMSAESNR
jgi:hypothetical protein